MAEEQKSDTPPLGLEDALRETLAAAQESGNESNDEGGGEPAAPEVEAQDKTETPDTDTDDQKPADEVTDGDGEAEEAEAETELAADDADQDDASGDDETDDDEEGAEEDDKSDLEAFSHLPAEQRAAIAKLDRPARDAVHDRMKFLEGNADKKFKEASALKKDADEASSGYKEFDRVLKPYDKHLAEAGLTPAQAVGQVLALRDGLVNDPVSGLTKIVDEFMVRRGEAGSSRAQQFVRQIATRLRVDLDGLDDLDETQAAPPSPEAELIAQQQAELRALRDQMNTFEQSSQTQAKNYGQSIWEAFAADEAHPYAEQLKPKIEHYLALPEAQGIADPQKRLKTVYEQAVWADPTTRAQLLEAEKAELRKQADEASKAAEEKRRAKVRKVSTAKAKAASTTPKAAAPTATVNDADLSFKDHMKNVFDEQAREGSTRL